LFHNDIDSFLEVLVSGEELSISMEVCYYNYKKFATIPLCEGGRGQAVTGGSSIENRLAEE